MREPPSMPTYRLLSQDGDDLGSFTDSQRPALVGRKVYLVTGEVFRVIRVVTAMDGDDIDGYLVVELLTGERSSN
jgi:hypothetical protein